MTLGIPVSSVIAGPATPSKSAMTTTLFSTSSSTVHRTVSLSTVTLGASPSITSPAAKVTSTLVPSVPHHDHTAVGAGVGGGVGGTILILAGIGCFVLWRRRQKRKENVIYELPAEDPADKANSPLFPAELSPEDARYSGNPVELASPPTGPHELSNEAQGTPTATQLQDDDDKIETTEPKAPIPDITPAIPRKDPRRSEGISSWSGPWQDHFYQR